MPTLALSEISDPNADPVMGVSSPSLGLYGGRCYLVLVEENKPKEIIAYVRKKGMNAKVSE